MEEKIKVGVCVMEKKVKCESEVLSFFQLHYPSFLLLLLRFVFVFVFCVLSFGGSVSEVLRCVRAELGGMCVCVEVIQSFQWLCFFRFSFFDCVLQVFSAPMGQIFDRLQAFGEFEVGEYKILCSLFPCSGLSALLC